MSVDVAEAEEATADGAGALALSDNICARLCHDIAGPLGTLMGALDLAAEDPDSADAALPIAQEAAVQMIDRLRLLRAAWAGDCGPLDEPSLLALAAGLPSRIQVDVSALRGPFPAALARVLVNMLLLATEALPAGGRIALSGAAADRVLLTITGNRAGWPPGMALALGRTLHDIDDPRAAQPPLAAALARRAGFRLALLLPVCDARHAVPPLLLAPI